MNNENPFRILFDRVYSYFTHSFMRRVLFFALAAVLICSVYLQIWYSQAMISAMLLFAIVGTFATFVDSIQSKHEFSVQLRKLEADYINRVYEKEGEAGLATMKRAFSREEIGFSRKKKREYNFLIFIKLLFTIILVVLFVQMM